LDHIILNPINRRVGRPFFFRELIIPNIGAFILILIIRILDLGTVGDWAIGGVAAILIWSGNFAAPMARLQDIGIHWAWHFAVVAIVFYLTTIGWQSGPAEAVSRFADWGSVLISDSGTEPEATGRSRELGGLVALAELGFLCFMRGQRGANGFGPDPRENA